MYIITVIPIKKGFPSEYLTYFSSQDIPLGYIVSIPIRSKAVDAIVVYTNDAQSVKSDLKSAQFQLKKIIKIKGPSPFTESFFEACKKMKNYTVSNTGVIIKSLLPSIFLENTSSLKSEPKNIESDDINTEKSSENIKHEKIIFQSFIDDRISWYRTLIRESFAKKESVFICVPTIYDIGLFENELKKGIEQYVFSFHGNTTKKISIEKYNTVINEPHPILIIGTGMFLSIPRKDIRTIILEHESSESYKQISKPYLDIRSFVEILSSINKIKLIFGDTLIRPDTLYRHEIGELGEVTSPIFRLSMADRQIVVDMKEEFDTKGRKTFTVLSEKTKQMIEYGLKNNESIFLFSVRKGLAPITTCNDCGNVLLCPACSTPIVLYGSKQSTATKTTTTRIFMCNKCGRKEMTETRCNLCSSWNLTPLGIGTDRVYEEVRKIFPDANIIQIDKESTPSDKEAKQSIEKFIKNPGSILIGTEMAFSYIENSITHSAIISLDGLLSIPSFNITQKILHIIEKLHYITSRNLIIQTRNPDNQILQYILNGNVLPLYREDLKERKAYGYPPFKKLIKITFSGTANETEKARSFLNKILEDYDPQIFSAFIGKIKGQYITNTIIKIDPNLWPLLNNEKTPLDKNLYENLSKLPPSFSINVDPEDLL